MDVLDELDRFGRVWCRQFFSSSEIRQLEPEFDFQRKPGKRVALTERLAGLIGHGSSTGTLVESLGLSPEPVRLVAFEKSVERNWSVPWHQDRVIAVRNKLDVAGYSNWVRKSGFWHCEAPAALLNSMIFIRIHIDPSTEENGSLEIALGSHKRGFVSVEETSETAKECPIEPCYAGTGDILIVRALTLHRSRPAKKPNHRRALRADFAPRHKLSTELSWAMG